MTQRVERVSSTPDAYAKGRENVREAVRRGQEAGFPMAQPKERQTQFRNQENGQFVSPVTAHDAMSG